VALRFDVDSQISGVQNVDEITDMTVTANPTNTTLQPEASF
jgi:hypothetical protein